MKAAVFRRQHQMVVIDVAPPRTRPGEVVLKVHDCGICGSDLHACQHSLTMPAGSIMGHEICGEVYQVGAGAHGLEVGQRVVVLPFTACGRCGRCTHGLELHCHDLRALGFGQLPGGYAEFVACQTTSVFTLPDHVGTREGALIEPLAVGLHAVNRSGASPGATAVVMGAGPIGLATLLWLKARGTTVVVSELAAGRRELARRLGADVVVNPNESNPSAMSRDMTGRSPELVFECVGVKGTLERAVALAGPRGQVVVVGVCMEIDQIRPAVCVQKEVSVDFVRGYDREEFTATIDAVARRAIEPQPMITDIIAVEEVPAMFEALLQPDTRGKVLVEFAR